MIPEDVTLDNFRAILSGNPGEEGSSEAALDVPYKNWYVNMIVVSGATALLSVFFGVIAAYAFARFRFKGRRMGMMSLILIQMFPTFLAVVAIYLIVLRVGDIFPAVGLDTRTGLILVYLGGVLGVNTWLMKGFLDSIPDSLDESARVDGATPAQVFWVVILPLAAPVLAVVGLISYIFSINEFIIASVLLDTTDKFTMSLGLYSFINDKYAQQWGTFCAGVILAAIPVVILFFFLQRFFTEGVTGRGEGLTVPSLLAQPHHDGSELYAPELAGRARRRDDGAPARAEGVRRGRRDRALRARRRAAGRACGGRPRDGRRTSGGARRFPSGTWRRRTAGCCRAVTSATRGSTRMGVQPFDVPDADDFIATPGPGWPRLAPRVRRVPGLPGSLRVVRARGGAARVGDPARLGRAPHRTRAGDSVRVVRRRSRSESRSVSTTSTSLGVNVLYLTPVFPAGSTHRYDATTFDAVDPLLGGDEALRLARRCCPRARHPRARRPDDEPRGLGHEWFEAARAGHEPERGFFFFDDALPARIRVLVRRAVAAEARLRVRGVARADVRRLGVGRSPLARAAVRPRRLAHRRREHDRPSRGRRPSSRRRCRRSRAPRSP